MFQFHFLAGGSKGKFKGCFLIVIAIAVISPMLTEL